MADAFDPHRKYDDKEYTITGKALNQIGIQMLDMKREIDHLKSIGDKEELAMLRLRDKNPAIKNAWDQYQIVLNLARN